MIVVADASPLIFLAKIRRLGAIFRVLSRDVRVPKQVCDEVLAPGADPAEIREIDRFLDQCQLREVRRPRLFAAGMSRADNAALTLAIREGAEILLCDERITRQLAEDEGIRPLGTLGVMLREVRAQVLSAEEARRLLDRLVQRHGFRIGVELYSEVLRRIEAESSER